MNHTDPHPSADRLPRTVSRGRIALIAVAVVVLGVVGRSVASDGADSVFVSWLPWLDRTNVTLFFTDAESDYLVPVSRTVSQDEATPQALMDALLAGPDEGSGLVNPIPVGVSGTIGLAGSHLIADLTSGDRELSFLAQEALLQSMRAWPDVETVTLTIDDVPIESITSGHVLYFYDEQLDMLVAQPTNLIRPGDVMTAWLEGPTDTRLIGLPGDIESLGVELAPNELLTLRFTFRESLRDFATNHPESVRRVLEGLIATFNTGFPDVGAVLLDFEGQNALGLGQCANLLNTAQGMPDVLNDERLLARYAGA